MRRMLAGLVLVLVAAVPASAQEVTYTACSAAQAVTAAADLLHVEAGADRSVEVLKVWIVPGSQTAAAYHQVVLRRTTAASTGGSTVTASPHDPNGAAFTGVVRYGAAGGGTDGVTLVNTSYFVPTATTLGSAAPVVLFDATADPTKAIVINAGGTTGIEVRNATGGAGGANHYACATFVERRR